MSTHVSHTTRLHAKRPILVQLRVIHGPFEGECRLQSGGGAWSTCNTSDALDVHTGRHTGAPPYGPQAQFGLSSPLQRTVHPPTERCQSQCDHNRGLPGHRLSTTSSPRRGSSHCCSSRPHSSSRRPHSSKKKLAQSSLPRGLMVRLPFSTDQLPPCTIQVQPVVTTRISTGVASSAKLQRRTG